MKKQPILKTIVTTLLVTLAATCPVSAQTDSTLQKATIAANIPDGKTPATKPYDWLRDKPLNSIGLCPFGLTRYRFTGYYPSVNDQGSPYPKTSQATIRLFNHTTH